MKIPEPPTLRRRQAALVALTSLVLLTLTACAAGAQHPSIQTLWRVSFASPTKVVATDATTAYVYSSEADTIAALDLSTGTTLWAKPASPEPSWYQVSSGRLTFTQSTQSGGTIISSLVSRDGSLTWARTSSGSMVAAWPDGQIVTQDQSELQRTDPAGVLTAPAWTAPHGCDISNAVSDVNATSSVVALVSCNDGKRSVVTLTGDLRPRATVKGPANATDIKVANDVVIVTDSEGSAWIVNTITGKLTAVRGDVHLDDASGMPFDVAHGGGLAALTASGEPRVATYLTFDGTGYGLESLSVHAEDGRTSQTVTYVGTDGQLTRTVDGGYLFSSTPSTNFSTIARIRTTEKDGALRAASPSQLPPSETITDAAGEAFQVTVIDAAHMQKVVVIAQPRFGPEVASVSLSRAASRKDAAAAVVLASRDAKDVRTVPIPHGVLTVADFNTFATVGPCVANIGRLDRQTDERLRAVSDVLFQSAEGKECTDHE